MSSEKKKLADQFKVIGARLKEAREKRGLNINDIASTTRISKPMLEKIETGDLEGLPGMTFVRGFVKSYAMLVGLDNDLLMDDLNKATRRQQEEVESVEKVPEEIQHREIHLPSARIVVAGLMAALLVWAGVSFVSGPEEPNGASEPNTTEERGSEPAQPDEAAASTPAPQKANTTSEGKSELMPEKGLRLSLKGVSPTWVRLSVDRGPAVEFQMQPSDAKDWVAQEEFRVTIGRADGVTAQLNGRNLRFGSGNVLVPNLVLNRSLLEH